MASPSALGAAAAPRSPHADGVLRALVVIAAVLYAAAIASLVVRRPAVAVALTLAPALAVWFARPARAFWTLVAVWMLGSESIALVTYVSVFKLLALVVVAGLGYELLTRRWTPTGPRVVVLPLLAWIALSALATLRGRHQSAVDLVALSAHFGLALCCMLPLWFVSRPEHVTRVVRLFRWQGVAAAGLGAMQIWFGDAFYVIKPEQVGRAHGFAGNPNGLGIAMALVMPLQLHAALNGRKAAHRAGWMGAAVLSGLALIYSLSRSALAGVALGIPLVLMPLTGRRVAVLAGVALVGAFLWRSHLADFAGARYDLGEVEEDPRRQALSEALRVFSENPVLGIGLGEFSRESAQGIPVHNAVVSVFVEAGVFAGVLFLWVVVGTTLRYLRHARNLPTAEGRSLSHALAAAWLSAFVALNFHGGTETSNLMWFLVGLSFALSRVEWTRPAEAPPAPRGVV